MELTIFEIGEWSNHGVGGGGNNRKNDGNFVIIDLPEGIEYFVLPCLQFSNPMSSSQIIKRKYSLTLSIATLKSLLLFSPYSATTTTTTTMTITTNFTKMIDENCWLTRADPVLLLNNLIKLFDQRKLLLTSSISITLVEDIDLLIEELSRLLMEYTSLPQDYDQNGLCLLFFF